MAKHNERHPATEQLSAFLDKQLSPEEQPTIEAHLQNCQQCQDALARLRQTVALLRALPQPELPRSFALSSGVHYLQEHPERQSETQHQHSRAIHQQTSRRSGLSYIQRAVRVASTLVAVVGLIFLLSTVLPAFPHGGASSVGTGSVPSAGVIRNHPATSTVKGTTPHNQGTGPTVVGQAKTPIATPTTPSAQDGAQFPPLSPLLPDVTTSLGRQEVGLFFLVLGVLGVLLTRRRQPRRRAS